MNSARVRRLVQLLHLLQGGRGHNANHLARECRCSRRTIFRDLDMLREAGVPLHYDDGLQQYHLAGPRLLPPTNFTTEEALALVLLCQELGQEGGLPFYGAARSAASKLESSLPVRIRDHLRELSPTVQIRLDAINPLPGPQSQYEQLLNSIAQRHMVRIRYGSLAEQAVISTKLSPYRLLFSRRSWYVIGRSSLHRATRTFNVGRIQKLELLDESYRIPRGFSLKRHLRNAWHLIPERGPDRQVVVRFSKQVAQNVAEVVWHRTQRIVDCPDGSIEFHAQVTGLGEITWWILGYGDQAEVLAPLELRDRIAQHARRMSQNYSHPPLDPAVSSRDHRVAGPA